MKQYNDGIICIQWQDAEAYMCLYVSSFMRSVILDRVCYMRDTFAVIQGLSVLLMPQNGYILQCKDGHEDLIPKL